MEISLENKVFFIHDNDGRVSDILKKDLIKIIELIRREIKNASVILGGSLAYGEGKYLEKKDKIEFLSDFDIFLIIPSLIETIRSMRNPNLKNLPESFRLSTSIEFIFVWERLLSLGLTTVAGEILVDNRRIKKVLNNLPVPRATNNLKRAFKYLLMGFTDCDKRGDYLGRALIQGFQALLMILRKDAGYGEWNNFFSLKYDLAAIDSVKDILGEDVCSLLKDIFKSFLDIEKKVHYRIEDFFLAREFLNRIYLKLDSTFKMNDYIRYITFHLKNNKIPNPFINSTRYYLDSSMMLLDAILDFDRFNELKLKEAEMLLNRLTGGEDIGKNLEDIFRKSVEQLRKYDEIYLHKVKQKANNFIPIN